MSTKLHGVTSQRTAFFRRIQSALSQRISKMYNVLIPYSRFLRENLKVAKKLSVIYGIRRCNALHEIEHQLPQMVNSKGRNMSKH